jgi:hypothetical protein
MQINLNKSIGNTLNWEKTVLGVAIQAENAFVTISLFSPGIVNIYISKEKKGQQPHSYAIVHRPEESIFTITESNGHLEINNGTFITQIQKNPLRINFLSIDKKAIC